MTRTHDIQPSTYHAGGKVICQGLLHHLHHQFNIFFRQGNIVGLTYIMMPDGNLPCNNIGEGVNKSRGLGKNSSLGIECLLEAAIAVAAAMLAKDNHGTVFAIHGFVRLTVRSTLLCDFLPLPILL